MSLQIRLLGAPAILGNDGPRRLGGRKPWGVLAVLALEGPTTRHSLVDLLFSQADDPLAALRWTLHQARRALAPHTEIAEEDGRLHLRLAPDAVVDVVELLSGRAGPDEVDELFGGELLEAMPFDDAPEFEQWLLLERARVSEGCFAAIWSAADSIARSDPDRALRLARRGLRDKPFCAGTNELVVDIMIEQNDVTSARSYVEALGRRWREELGEPLPASIRRPLERSSTAGRSLRPDLAAPGLVHAARARMAAGDYWGAIETARRAADLASVSRDPAVELEALTTLVTVLVHSVRGHDEEAKGLIHRAVTLAADLGDDAALSDVMREAGFVQAMEANYGGAEVSLRRATDAARTIGDPMREAKAIAYLGLVVSDRGAYEEAEPLARSAVGLFERAGEHGWSGYALGCVARILLRTGRIDEAANAATRGVEAARSADSIAMLPWPMVQAGEAAFLAGQIERSEALFSEAFAIAVQIEDPGWEGLALRGLALLAGHRGDGSAARDMLADARERTRRFPDVYKWAEALILTDLTELEGGADPEHLASALELALTGPMADLAERLLRLPSAQGLLEAQTLRLTAPA